MSVTTLLVPAICSLALCLLLTPLLRNLAVRFELVDRPDLDRKLHEVAVPRIGGVPVVLACLIAVATVILLETRGAVEWNRGASLALWVLPASILVFLTGLVDDLIGLRPLQKLGGQVIGAVFVCMAGVRFQVGDGWWAELLGVGLTVLWLVACSNAFNLIDGVDGLATGLGIIAGLTILLSAIMSANAGLIVLSASMTGALLGFLFFNFNPASIFLGDSGSLWTGFMLGCLALLWPYNSETVLSMIAPAIALSIPLTDTMLSITRRYVAARPIFGADHGHIHHRLLERRLTPRNVALCLYVAGIMTSCFAIALSVTSQRVSILIAGVFCVAAAVAIRSLVYDEFQILAALLRGVRLNVRYRLLVRKYESQLREAASPDACWCIVRSMCREFGFSSVALRLGGYSFSDQFILSRSQVWALQIPLSASDDVIVTHRLVFRDATDTVGRVTDMLHRTLSVKAESFAYSERHDGTFGPRRSGIYARR